MKKYFIAILICPLFIMFLLLNGCATIVSGTSESVSVSTSPISGATCTLSNDEGKWYIPMTPSSVVIHKSYAYLDVECQKAGYYDGYARIKSNLKPMILGNAIFGGAIGIGIDTLNGAAFSYPVNIQVPMLLRNS